MELALLVSIGVLVLAARPAVETVAFAWWLLCALPLFFVDLAVHRLPDRLTSAAAFGTWGLLGLAALAGDSGTAAGGGADWLRALLAGARSPSSSPPRRCCSVGVGSVWATPSWC